MCVYVCVNVCVVYVSNSNQSANLNQNLSYESKAAFFEPLKTHTHKNKHQAAVQQEV